MCVYVYIYMILHISFMFQIFGMFHIACMFEIPYCMRISHSVVTGLDHIVG